MTSNRHFVTFFAFSDDNELAALKDDNNRTIDFYLKSLLEAQMRLPNLVIYSDSSTIRRIREKEEYVHLNLSSIDTTQLDEDRRKFERLLSSGVKSMMSRQEVGNFAHANYLAIIHNKIKYMMEYAATNNVKNEPIVWVDAGIYSTGHTHFHGSQNYQIEPMDTARFRYAVSFKFVDLFKKSLLASILLGTSKTQLCAPVFSINSDDLLEVSNEITRVVDYTIEQYSFIPTEQCSYLIALINLNIAPKYIVKHYRGIYSYMLGVKSSSVRSRITSALIMKLLRNEVARAFP